ncbi:MAG: type 4a pilus biogenesis protein PilO [Clostridia bacterium]|nr:type 4a pilus biogenesis protein PilO [Clostridia bacterium]
MKGKKIELKDITSSPFFVIGIMSFVCILIIVGIVFVMLDIDKTKNEIVDARVMYEQNVREVALLEELKVKSEAAEQQLEACKNILPDSLGDVFLLEEDVLGKCKSFGLSVTSIDQTVAVNETQEVVFTIVANGSYRNIYDFMNYYSNLEQVHRFDSISLSRNADGTYSVTLALAFLSEQGAEGAVSAVVDGAIQDAAS